MIASTVLTPAQFRAATAAVLMTILMAALDQTIVSVAVPTIARELGGFDWMSWVISSYLIASTVVTPLYGRFSDLVGRRKVMTIAIVVFLAGSIGCALAPTMPVLVLARVLQGIGGGGLIATAQSVIADVVPLRERGRYQSYVSIVWAVASMVGPVVGGFLTEYLSWPWIFWINLPVGVVSLILVRGALKALPVVRRDVTIDIPGAVLLLGGITALLVPITRVGQGVSWVEAGNLVGWVLALVLLTVFVVQQRRQAHPIIPLALFANRTVVACSLLLFVCFFNFIALSVLVPLRLQLVAGFSPGDAALHLLPLTLAIPFAVFSGGQWLSRVGRVLPLQRAGVIMVPVGLFVASFSPSTGVVAMGALIVLGIGLGLQLPTTLITAQQSVPVEQIGTVTALTSFFRLLGGAIGIAVLSSIALLLLRQYLPPGVNSLDIEQPGGLVGAAAVGADDAFRQVLRVSGVLTLVSIWLVTMLPDLRLHDGKAAVREASSAEA